MIQVPEEVKALFKQDSVAKTFRVKFPNGEFRDLVNGDIVAESVVFTESVSSGNGLKYGMCEGSVLEFETFFNQNIRNLKIYAEIEVDVSSIIDTLDASDVKTSSDVPYPYYPIPYGFFYVDSCKRDIQSNIRKIIAYQNKWDVYGISEFIKIPDDEKAKLAAEVYVASEDAIPPYTNNTHKFLCSCLNSTNVLGGNFTTTDVSPRAGSMHEERSSKLISNKGVVIDLVIDYRRIYLLSRIDTSSLNTYYHLDVGGDSFYDYLYQMQYTNTIDVNNAVKSIIIDFVRDNPLIWGIVTDYSDEEVLELFKKRIGPWWGDWHAWLPYVYPSVKYIGNYSKYLGSVSPDTIVGGSFMDKVNTYPGKDKTILFYPYMTDFYSISKTIDNTEYFNWGYINIPYKMHLTYIIPSQTSGSTADYYVNDYDTLTVSRINMPFDYDFSVERKKTWVYGSRIYASAKYIADDIKHEVLDVKDMASSLAELQGSFLKLRRDSEIFELIKLERNDALYPRTDLFPSQELFPKGPMHFIGSGVLKSAWYDDKFTNGYDRVCCTWTDADGNSKYSERLIVDIEANDYFPSDYQSYDISNNYFIKTKGMLTESQVNDILDYLADVLKTTQYYVSTIEMRALPYLEAGDEVVVGTIDGGFSTFALKHRISGICALMDLIESR